MSTSVAYPGARPQPGSPTAKTIAAGAVIALSTAIAAAALVGGIAAGSTVEAPTSVTQRASETTPPITTTFTDLKN